ncbi:MAG: xanthine dehydrogenase family protein subunit M [Deltaproteobacteria bacterium]|nr:xanthine dehydrogenase family protein subunit M [Deltaproteobacteria bacterium]
MSHVFLPPDLDRLWNILEENPGALLYAGGTDLLVRLRQNPLKPPSLVCLERIEELHGVRERGEEVFIGACATHTGLLADAIIRDNFPVLVKGLACLGSPPIRNMGTIGGNICTASPAGDALPPLYTLDAGLEIRSRNSSRRMALTDFILGPGKTSLQQGEILAGVWLNRHPPFAIHHFEKVGQRNALAISLVSLAALLTVSAPGIIERVRLAWGSVAPTVATSAAVEAMLTGRPLSRETMDSAIPLIGDAISPISDTRATARYRRTVAGNLLLRLIEVDRRCK